MKPVLITLFFLQSFYGFAQLKQAYRSDWLPTKLDEHVTVNLPGTPHLSDSGEVTQWKLIIDSTIFFATKAPAKSFWPDLDSVKQSIKDISEKDINRAMIHWHLKNSEAEFAILESKPRIINNIESLELMTKQGVSNETAFIQQEVFFYYKNYIYQISYRWSIENVGLKQRVSDKLFKNISIVQ